MSKAKPSPTPPQPTETDQPEGWACPFVRDVLDVKYGKGLPEKSRKDGPYAVYGSNGVVGHHEEPLTAGPTIILGRKGTVGAVHYSREPCWPIDTTYFIEEVPGLDMGFLYYALSTLGLSEMDTSSAIPGLNREDVFAQTFPLPPSAEQKRIVARVEALFERVNAARARLARLPAILKRFRQAVLAAACSGQLTAEWREAHPNTEPAEALLARIRSARTETAETTREKRQIEEAFSEAQFTVSEDEIAFGEVPESWLLCRIGAIGAVLNGSTPSRKHPEYWDGDIAWVSSGEVRNNIITETRERITPLGYGNTSVKLLPSGTVLLAMIGEGKTRGQSAVLRIESTINQNIAAVLLSHGLIVPEFLWRWFQFQYEATRVQGGGSGPQALNCQRVRELPFVLPPLDEQREIVRRLEATFALADGIEAHVRAATVRAERLPQTILARAFRGELVPTEADLASQEGREYEPASVLLARIQEEREASRSTLPRAKKERNAMVRSELRMKSSVTATVRRPLMNVFNDQKRRLTPEQLFQLAGFDEASVDEFYQQLRTLVEQGRLREVRPNKKDVYIEVTQK